MPCPFSNGSVFLQSADGLEMRERLVNLVVESLRLFLNNLNQIYLRFIGRNAPASLNTFFFYFFFSIALIEARKTIKSHQLAN